MFENMIKEFSLDLSNKKLHYKENFKAFVQNHRVSEFVEINPKLAEKSKDSKEVTLKYDIDITYKLKPEVDPVSFCLTLQ